MRAKTVYKSINERFKRGLDPKKAMGIGLMAEIKREMESEGQKWEGLDSALVWASMEGYEDYVKHLLEHGANVHIWDEEPIRRAIVNGHTTIVELLIKAGSNAHIENDYYLSVAADRGHRDIVELLLKAGADVHADDDAALSQALRRGYFDTVEVLLNAGANLERALEIIFKQRGY